MNIKQISIILQTNRIVLEEFSQNGIMVEIATSTGATINRIKTKGYFVPIPEGEQVNQKNLTEVLAIIKESKVLSKKKIEKDLGSKSYVIISYVMCNRKTYDIPGWDTSKKQQLFGWGPQPAIYEKLSGSYVVFPESRFVSAEKFTEISDDIDQLENSQECWQEGLAFQDFGYLGIDPETDTIVMLSIAQYNRLFGFLLAKKVENPFVNKKKENQQSTFFGRGWPHFGAILPFP